MALRNNNNNSNSPSVLYADSAHHNHFVEKRAELCLLLAAGSRRFRSRGKTRLIRQSSCGEDVCVCFVFFSRVIRPTPPGEQVSQETCQARQKTRAVGAGEGPSNAPH